jgi:F-type H+-transporting ATPase subunit c
VFNQEISPVNKFLRMLAFAFFVVCVADLASAQAPAPAAAPAATVAVQGSAVYLGAAIGAGIVMLGGGWGISKIGASAVDAMARQPEAAANIQTAMIISAALIEGATFFALIVCIAK